MAQARDDFVIRALTAEDAGALAELEVRCAGAARWGEGGYREIVANGITGWVAAREKILSGFILVRAVADEMEILNLAVDSGDRRKGIAAQLLARAVEEERIKGVARVYLEVRESNSAAREFYLSRGFKEYRRRTKYYSQPVEDALLLVLNPVNKL